MNETTESTTDGAPEDDIKVREAERLDDEQMAQLCEATALAVADGEDIAWINPPSRTSLESYWKGILLAPHRTLFLAFHDGRVCGACQLILPGAINEAGAHAGEIATFFVAPWARGHGHARALFDRAESEAQAAGLKVLDFSIRADRIAGIALVESLGYRRWAEKPHYAYIRGAFHTGYYYTKMLNGAPAPGESATR